MSENEESADVFSFSAWLDDAKLSHKTADVLRQKGYTTRAALFMLSEKVITELELSVNQKRHLSKAVKQIKDMPDQELGELGLPSQAPGSEAARPEDILPEAEEIRSKLQQGLPRQPTFNILLLGSPGAGKSSLINSMIAALDKRGYREVATTGFGGGEEKGAVTTGLRKIKLFNKQEGAEYACKPAFNDIPGLQNENNADVIRKVLSGSVNHRASLKEIKEAQFVDSNDTDARMHLVMFVHAYHVPPNEQLLESLATLTRSCECTKYDTPTVLVLTHADKAKVTEEEIRKEMDKQTTYIPQQDLIRKIRSRKIQEAADSAAVYLKMKKQPNRIAAVTCYSAETAGNEEGDPTYQRRHDLDRDLCKLWNKILPEHYYYDFE